MLNPYRRHRVRWGSAAFFAGIHLAAFVGAPWYALTHGIAPAVVWLCAFYSIVTVLSITIGYHRLFAHAAFKAHPAVRFLVLFFGAAAFEQSALKWASMHRTHHKYADAAQDPYNIKAGFFYAHIGWILFWKHAVSCDNVKDLQKSRLVTHQHRAYQGWAFAAGLILPLVIGALYGDVIGTLLVAVAARMVVVFHATFFINSVAHTFGAATYDFHSSARDSWICAFLTNGEGYHNFHHRFPSDYRNGLRWFDWDPGKWLIWALSCLGLAWDLNKTPHFRVLRARVQAGKDARAAAGPFRPVSITQALFS